MKKTKVLAVICAISMFVRVSVGSKETNHRDMGI